MARRKKTIDQDFIDEEELKEVEEEKIRELSEEEFEELESQLPEIPSDSDDSTPVETDIFKPDLNRNRIPLNEVVDFIYSNESKENLEYSISMHWGDGILDDEAREFFSPAKPKTDDENVLNAYFQQLDEWHNLHPEIWNNQADIMEYLADDKQRKKIKKTFLDREAEITTNAVKEAFKTPEKAVFLNITNLSTIKWSGKRFSFLAERYLIDLYQKYDDPYAIGALVVHNIAMVKKLIMYAKTPESYFEDALTEGTLGLIASVKKFDLTRKTRLSTYATFHIRLGITRFNDTSTKTIRIPVNKTTAIRKEAKEKGGKYENISEDLKKVYQLNQTLSLDFPIETSQSQEKTVHDIIPDNRPTPEQEFDKVSLRDELTKVLDMFPTREAHVIKSYYGVGEPQKNLNDLSKELGVTHQRTSQILKSTVAKLYDTPSTREALKQIGVNWEVLDISYSEKRIREKQKKSDELKKKAKFANSKIEKLDTLSDREKDLLIGCYGLNSSKPKSINTLAKKHNIPKFQAEEELSIAFHKLSGNLQEKLCSINPKCDKIVLNN